VRTAAVGYNPNQGTHGQAGYTMWPASSPWILNTYSFSWESEGSQLLYRSYCFDSTGFLIGRRVHVANDASYRTNDLVEVFARNAAGNLTSESYYGGDSRTIPADPAQGFVCSLVNTLTSHSYRITHSYSGGVRATSRYTVAGTTLWVLEQTIDLSTGLASSSRDTAGIEERYTYDSLGRLTLAEPRGDPAISTDPTDAIRSYNYCTATSATPCPSGVKAQVFVSQGGVNPPESRFRFDAWGRLITEEERMPPNGTYSKQSFEYNAMGWKTWASAQGTSATGTTYKNFDAFGRPTLITPADGTGHNITLAYAGARQVSRTVKVKTAIGSPETAATTTEIYDRFGRLHEVTEPNGTVTRYAYDAGNRLKQVCQAVTSTGACGQERLFTYDNRGFLLWENHPEKTANIYGQSHDVDYPSYDARGHVLRKVDGDNDLTFEYDLAERLTLVRETGAGACITTSGTVGPRCLKSFTYATANGTNAAGLTDYRKGKVTSASRYNYVGAPFNATVEVKETYEYTGRGGRVSQKDTYQIFNGGNSEIFRQTFSWNDLGTLASETYPDCIASTVCGPSSPRSVSYGYTRGRLTSVSGFATSITYHANGLVHQVSRPNGVTDYQNLDSSGMTRPASISAQRNSDGSVLWNTGTYQYDGSGNVWQMGATTYLYDSLSRVISGTVYPGALATGTAHTQSYAYDNYGNLKSTTTSGVLLNTPTATATNRLSAGTYDRAGNLTGWSGNTYEYDAFNQMKRMVSGAEDWRYMYTASDERFWSYRASGGGSVWSLRGLDAQVLREYSAHLGWNNYRDYIHRGGTLLASVDSAAAGGAVRHLHTDHLGTPRLITDATGSPATAKFHTYYPFGEEIAGTYTASYTDRMRFTGHERDLANITGQGDDLDYMHARHYGPVTGRFNSPDPINTSVLESPQRWNKYSYAIGNPLRYVDPNGLEPLESSVKQFLEAFFRADLSHIDVRSGSLASKMTSMFSTSALTLGNSVLLSGDLNRAYQAKTPEAIAIMAHEVAHTFDFEALGAGPMLANLIGIQQFRGLMETGSAYQAYRNTTFEGRGWDTENLVKEFFATPAGREV
jgi:RHS repeat-associated protein